MTLIAASIAVDGPEGVASGLGDATNAVAAGARLVEWRVDRLATNERAADLICELLRESPAPSILTCRSAAEGGGYAGTEHERRELIKSVIRQGPAPRYIDIELSAFEQDAAGWLAAVRGGAEEPAPPERAPAIMLSVHDFNGRPADLLRRIERMANHRDCAVIKIAWMARSLRDNIEAFDLLAARHKPTIALCMGPFGLPSRVLAPKFGGFITFATPQADAVTAPGQPTVEDLLVRYRFDSIGPETRLYGVVGWPIGHSLGPVIHNAAFAHLDINAVYLPLPVPGGPDAYEPFKATIGELVEAGRLGFRGASVTLPHKENLIRFVEECGGRVEPIASLAGAANTLIVGSAGALACRNTDALAIVDALSDALNVPGAALRGRRIAILGAGGVARAAVAGLVQHGAAIRVFNRSEDRAHTLVDDLGRRASDSGLEPHLRAAPLSELATFDFEILINCTSIGMSGGPAPHATPQDVLGAGDLRLDDAVTVFDTVYSPARTPLIEEAESRGARVILGIDLFIRQAALQFESWTGERAPIDLWRDLLAEHVEA